MKPEKLLTILTWLDIIFTIGIVVICILISMSPEEIQAGEAPRVFFLIAILAFVKVVKWQTRRKIAKENNPQL